MSVGSVLVVDDNPANLRLAEVLLNAGGFEVRCASHAEDALAALSSRHPQIILMDLQLPGTDGFALTRRLKADDATRDICIIAMTAYAMSGDEARAREAGCDGYLSKPLDPETFIASVKAFLGA